MTTPTPPAPSANIPVTMRFSGIIGVYKRDAPGDVRASRGQAPSVRSTSMQHDDTASSIPYGYCQCGCGEKTTIADKTTAKLGIFKGQPRKYIANHAGRRPILPARWSPEHQSYVVPLSSDKYPQLVALIDECDREWVSRYSWHPIVSVKPSRTLIYAERRLPRSHGSRGLMMHREILQAPDGMQVDHINGNSLDNRRSNLRLANQSQNNANQILSRNNTSGFKGVSWMKRERRWRASIKVNGVVRELGYFRIKEDAARAYDRAAVDIFGEFALTNEALGLFAPEAE